ncbi:Hsp20/alpha crystallin family protein [Photobacterium ganghwense]|uniref:Hsp20/alpha crystallin family protein n=1 Tax=Photobacterium ganghwense TaxID=320778 RepID=UPI00405721EE
MSLVPRDSWFDFSQMFDHAFPTLRHSFDNDVCSPRINLIEKEDGFEITADLPGVKKDDINVQLANGSLMIEATSKRNEEQEKNGKVIRQERYEGKFMRSFYLGQNVKEDDVHASFTDGVLTIQVPKVEASLPDSKRIDIK